MTKTAAPIPTDPNLLAEYLVDFLTRRGVDLDDALTEVHGLTPASLRSAADYAHAVDEALIDINILRREARASAWLMRWTPLVLVTCTLWYVLAPVMPGPLWDSVNLAFGAAAVALLIIAVPRRRKHRA